ncbi:CopG family transcriptional regulator [Ignatzschineria cameli]|nr:CopG family transcriptional regulator [Ignatzschineria cameli]
MEKDQLNSKGLLTMTREKMLAIELPEEISTRLTALAHKAGISEEEYIKEALLEHIIDIEEAQIAEQILERIHQGQESTHSSKEVRRRLGLES